MFHRPIKNEARRDPFIRTVSPEGVSDCTNGSAVASCCLALSEQLLDHVSAEGGSPQVHQRLSRFDPAHAHVPRRAVGGEASQKEPASLLHTFVPLDKLPLAGRFVVVEVGKNGGVVEQDVRRFDELLVCDLRRHEGAPLVLASVTPAQVGVEVVGPAESLFAIFHYGLPLEVCIAISAQAVA